MNDGQSVTMTFPREDGKQVKAIETLLPGAEMPAYRFEVEGEKDITAFLYKGEGFWILDLPASSPQQDRRIEGGSLQEVLPVLYARVKKTR